MTYTWKQALDRWTAAALIDADTADRIRAFEAERRGAARLKSPALLALAFGALLVGAGILLFVAAHWDAMSPQARFGLVLALVAGFHVGAAATASAFASLSTTLNALGTIALGAGVFLTGQIFNLETHWPAGVMLWAGGAVAAWLLLRDTPQFALAAVLLPAWLYSEWIARLGAFYWQGYQVLSAGLFLLALTYLGATDHERTTLQRRALMWIGGLALPITAINLASSGRPSAAIPAALNMSLGDLAIGWTVAIALPLLVAALLHRDRAWPYLLAAAWVVVETNTQGWATYGWWIVGASALAAWGVRVGRSERVNFAVAAFAGTVLAFYFSEIMDKLERSASLVGLGLLFLVGGWGLERLRRTLVQTSKEVSS
jgi:uncharacterized membrane protein